MTLVDRDVQWDQVARSLGAVDGNRETGGTAIACGALNLLLQPWFFEEAANWYVLRREGSETAWSVLRMIRPPVVMQLCVSNIRNDLDPQNRFWWAKLLSEICDHTMLPLVPELITDRDDGVKYCGTRIAAELDLRDELSDHDRDMCIRLFDASPHAAVRAAADMLRAGGYFDEVE